MTPAILQPSRNVWRLEHAQRAAVLVDGAALFGAVREAMLAARHSIFVVGWDIDSRTRLVGESGQADDNLPVTLVEFLRALVERRPELVVHLLLWDFSVLYALEREFLPRYALDWSTPKQIRLCIDKQAPLGSSQHQKIIVVDDQAAFSGGLDLTIRRWDTPEHSLDNPQRVDPAGKPYRPFHDVQAVVDGDAARALGELVRERWRRAQCSEPVAAMADAQGDCWPGGVAPDFTEIDIGISRTEPDYGGDRGIHEVEKLFLDSIDAAEHFIYAENQFVTSTEIAERLARRMKKKPKLETIIVGPNTPENWFEVHSMRNGRIRFRKILEEAGMGERFRLVYPEVSNGEETTDTMIHSKVMVVDDKFLRVGSANMNNRSMGADTECDLAIEAKNNADREAIIRIRDRLLGEHCGASGEEVARLLDETGSLVAIADGLSRNGHRLRRIDDGEPDGEELGAVISEIADPARPIAPHSLLAATSQGIGKLTGSKPAKFAMMALVLLALTLAWRYTPLADYTNPDTVRAGFTTFREASWAPLAMLAIYLVGGLIAFPLLILIAATAAAFGPVLGIAYSAVGAIASALLTYGIGAKLGREALHNMLGPRLERVRAQIARQGVLAVAAIRLVPIAPFTVVNLVAGASEIRVFDFILGTLIGLAPGIIVLGLLGHEVFRLFANPSFAEVALLAGAIAAWIALTVGIQALILKYGERPS